MPIATLLLAHISNDATLAATLNATAYGLPGAQTQE